MILQLNIAPNINHPKKWIKTKIGYFSGVVFEGDNLLSDQEIKTKIETIKNVEQATAFVKKINGSFAMVLDIRGEIFLAVDHERTIPIFYKIKGSRVYVYTHVSLDMIREHGINELALEELNNCLFVSGNETIACGIYSVMAGEVVTIDQGCVKKNYYFEFDFEKKEYPNKGALLQMMDVTFVRVMKRLIRVLNGRCAVVPLSGGHDSRLVVYYLKRLGYDNIITYTYGLKGNFEAITSEKVAKFLGLDWHYVEYEPQKLQKLFKKEFNNLVEYCSNGVSSVCIQDWFAVFYLHEKGILPKDAVFVPGHSFDAVAGSFILPHYIQSETITKNQLVNDILKKHYSEGKRKVSPKKRKYFENKIRKELLEGESEILKCNRAFDLYQSYNCRERQAKYICCQPKIYEYYGYDWYLPLWDDELVAFWESIDIKQKYNRKLFFEFTKYQYGDLMLAAPIENEKSKESKTVNMNPLIRIIRKINQLIHYVEFHYCLAYFKPYEIYSMYIRKRVLNIGFFVNQKIIGIVRRKK